MGDRQRLEQQLRGTNTQHSGLSTQHYLLACMNAHDSTLVSSSCSDAMLCWISMRNGIRRASSEIHTFTPPGHFRPPGASTISKPSAPTFWPAISNTRRSAGFRITGYTSPSDKIFVGGGPWIVGAFW